MKNTKELALAIIVIITATLGFTILNLATNNLWLLILALIPLPLFWAIQISLSKNYYVILATTIISIATFFIIFPNKPYYWASALFAVILMFYGYIVCNHTKKTLLKISISSIANTPLSYLMYGLVTIFSLAAYYSTPIQNMKTNFRIPPKLIEISASKIIPGYDSKATIDSLISNAIKLPGGEMISSEEKALIMEQLGIDKYNLQGNEKLSDKPQVLGDIVNSQIEKSIGSLGNFIPLVVASTLWTVLIVIAKMMVPIILLLGALLLKLLIKIGFVTVTTTTVEREELGL
jgi:hypothetical protein